MGAGPMVPEEEEEEEEDNDMMFIVLLSWWQSHCESSHSSSDEYRLSIDQRVTITTLDKANQLGLWFSW